HGLGLLVRRTLAPDHHRETAFCGTDGTTRDRGVHDIDSFGSSGCGELWCGADVDGRVDRDDGSGSGVLQQLSNDVTNLLVSEHDDRDDIALNRNVLERAEACTVLDVRRRDVFPD